MLPRKNTTQPQRYRDLPGWDFAARLVIADYGDWFVSPVEGVGYWIAPYRDMPVTKSLVFDLAHLWAKYVPVEVRRARAIKSANDVGRIAAAR